MKFYKMVPNYSGGLKGTTYQIHSQLPPVSVPGQEVTAKCYRCLQISHSRPKGAKASPLETFL